MYSSGSDTFYKYYQQQQQGGALAHVGGIPVFRGSRRQTGAGLGDILRSAFRWFLPVAKRGAMTFAKNVIQNMDKGTSLADAAKQAIMPTVGVAVNAARNAATGSERTIPSLYSANIGRDPAVAAKIMEAYQPRLPSYEEATQGGKGLRRSKRKATKRKRAQTGKGRVYKGAKKRRLGKAKSHRQVGSGAKKRKAKSQSGGKKRSNKKARKTVKKQKRVRQQAVDSAPYYNF